MRPTMSQLRSWDISSLADAGSTATAHAAEYGSALANSERAIADIAGWFGSTHDAATRKVEEEVDHGTEIRNALQHLADETLDAARELGHAREYVLGIFDTVPSGFNKTDEGRVTHPDEAKTAEAEHIQFLIQSGLDEVERLDGHYGQIINDIHADLAAMREGQPDITLPNGRVADPDSVAAELKTMTADEVSTMFNDLDSEAVLALIAADPQTIGNTNGVPFDVRATANEINIRNSLADEYAKAEPNEARIDQLKTMLTPINDPSKTDRIDQVIPATGDDATVDDSVVERKYISFSPEGNGRAIEMIGTIEPGIDGVGVYVPGTGTVLDHSTPNHNAGWNLAEESNAPVFLYMDGDFPTNLYAEAPSPSYAQDMAPKLVEFGKEIDREVADKAPGTAVTYIGHSYGGSIVGSAEQLGLRADRVLHASSAGIGTFGTEWNNPNPNVARYSMTVPGDPIGTVQSIPTSNVDIIPGSGNFTVPNPHGGDPDEAPGVTRLDTGYYGPNYGRANEVVFGPDGHGGYWNDPESTAFQNMVGVISGGEVTGYVERGIESNGVDVNLGDDGNFTQELYDSARGASRDGLAGLGVGPFRFPQSWADSFDNPRVTDNPQLGHKLSVESGQGSATS